MAVSPPLHPPHPATTREVQLVRFVGSLCAAASLEQLERRFVSGFARVSEAPMRVRHVVELPLISSGRVIGDVHFAESDPERDFGADDVALAEAAAQVLGETADRVRAADRSEREREVMAAALDLTATPVVVADPEEAGLRTNAAAERLLGQLSDAGECLHRLLARPAEESAFSRRIDVELASGERAVLQATATPLGEGVVAVLELQRERPGVSPGALAPLTAREAEVAVLIADGLATARSPSGSTSATTRSASTSNASIASSTSTRAWR
jgi:hypothetical protein